MAYRNLNVLDAAQQAAKQINALIDRPRRRKLLHVRQLRKSAQSVAANIAEAFGRGPGPDRDRILRIARGESEETIGHLKGNLDADRIDEKEHRLMHSRYVVIVKMLDSILKD